MAWWFQRSKKVGPFRINLSKNGIGVSVGVRGARVGVDSRGRVYRHLSLPGTGLRSREYLSTQKRASGGEGFRPPRASASQHGGTGRAGPPMGRGASAPPPVRPRIPVYIVGWAMAATLALALGSLSALATVLVGCGVHYLVRSTRSGTSREEQAVDELQNSLVDLRVTTEKLAAKVKEELKNEPRPKPDREKKLRELFKSLDELDEEIDSF